MNKKKQIPRGNDRKKGDGRSYGKAEADPPPLAKDEITGVTILGLGALGAGYGGAGFLIAFAGAFGGALVPILLAFGESDFALDAAVPEIKFDGDQRVAFLLRQTFEFFNLFFVEQEFTGT